MSAARRSATVAGVAVGLVLAITLTEAFAQTCLRTACDEHASVNGSTTPRCFTLLAAGAVAYALVAYLLFRAYRYTNLGHLNLIWSCASIVIAFTVGYVLFGETANRYTYAAIALACAAIFMAHKSNEV